MDGINRLNHRPVRTPRTRRNHPLQIGTSFMPGLCVPLAAMPLFREDSMNGDVTVTVEMMETHELLMNSTNLRVTAYFVPYQAFDRFDGSRDQLDRSYMGQPKIDGGAVVPFFETQVAPAVGTNPILRAMGEHANAGDTVNTSFIEAYNQIINMRLTNRSPNLPKRTRLDTSLAPAFWLNSQWQHVVPDFDQAVIDGEVALNIVNDKMPVRGIGFTDTAPATLISSASLVRTASGDVVPATSGTSNRWSSGGAAANTPALKMAEGAASVNYTDIWAQMQEGGLTVSLAEIAMAKKAQWFAKLRESYSGIEDEYLIDMLMSGLSIPDQAMKRPILIADQTTKFRQAKRYASDYANMAESAVSGAASLSFTLAVPQQNVGGIVMIMAEALPDQLFERQANPYLYATQVSQLPDALRDELDVQKVDLVTNRQVDVTHATPAATFGYEPMNAKWNRWGPKLGGKFFRPATTGSNDEVRQRLWAIELANPVLGASFYLCPPIHLKPFLDTASDPFEATVAGGAVITGNTVFGGMLVENTNLYAKVIAKNPTTQAKP